MKTQKLLTIILAQLCAFASVKTAAQAIQTVTVSVTAITQSSSSSTGANSNVVTQITSTQTHTTAEFLSRLAQDENMEANWPSNSFPAGVQLAAVQGQGVGDSTIVVVQGTNVLVDVSDIVRFHRGGAVIFSGTENLQTQLASPSLKTIYLGILNFDDSFVGNPNGSLSFSLTGVITETRTDTTPKNGVYTETISAKMTMGTGEGSSLNGPFICTGTFAASSKAVLPAP